MKSFALTQEYVCIGRPVQSCNRVFVFVLVDIQYNFDEVFGTV